MQPRSPWQRSMTVPGQRRSRRRLPGWALAAAAGISLALAPAWSPAVAQYTPPGTSEAASEMPPKADLVDRYTKARWSLGGLRLEPWLGIQDAAFVSSTRTVDAGDDFTITVGAGLRAYLKTGAKIFLSAHALPGYVWWQDIEQKRRLNGTYGFGIFGYFNRLTLEVSRRRVEEQLFFSTELQELTNTRRDVSRLALALELGNRLEVFTSGQLLERENLEPENPTFFLLDRQEETLELGVRYRSPQGLWAELALEDRTNDFAEGARNLSNSGTYERLSFGLDQPTLELRLSLAASSLDPELGSEFRSTDKKTGGFEVLWRPSRRLDLLAYARRDLRFSVDPGSSYYLSQRQGLRFNLQYRIGLLSLLGELGDDQFAPLTGAPRRLDDVTVWGAELRVELGRLAALLLRAVRTEYDSTIDEFDREVTTAGLTIELGGIIERLRLGSGANQW